MKTHLAPPFLPEQIWEMKPKLIHVSRNIKDVALSGYHMGKELIGIEIKIEHSLEAFLNDAVHYAPFVAHNELCWDLEEQGYPNILYLNYDEMMLDVEATIKKVQKFLGKHYSDEEILLLKEHLSFKNMKSMWNARSPIYKFFKFLIQTDNKAVNRSEWCTPEAPDKTIFMRKGKSGSYKEEISQEYIEKFDNLVKSSPNFKKHRYSLI
jgi:hypothetical protein